MNSEVYKWYKSRGICPRCTKNRAFGKYVLCAKCIEYRTLHRIKVMSNPERAMDLRIKARENRKKRYYELKQKGVCVDCGKKEAKKGIVCYECWLKRRKHWKK